MLDPSSFLPDLVDHTWADLVAAARRLRGAAIKESEVMDALHDSIALVLERYQDRAPRDEQQFVAWILTIAHNRIRDQLRRRRPTPVPPAELEAHAQARDGEPEPWRAAAQRERHHWLRLALRAAPSVQQDVVRLRYFDQLSFREIGARTARSDNAVELLHRRTLRGLARALEPLQSQ